MDKRFAIFDMDGTLIDSMSYWRNLGWEYLKSQGIEATTEQLAPAKTMTLPQSTQFMIETFGLNKTVDEILEEINQILQRYYTEALPLKEGIVPYLQHFMQRQVRMCVATATGLSLSQTCLQRLDILQYFQFVSSCEELGLGKDRPDIFLQAAQALGGPPEETAVYEDALYAAKTAKAAGFYLVAVYDHQSPQEWTELTELADEIILDWRTAL